MLFDNFNNLIFLLIIQFFVKILSYVWTYIVKVVYCTVVFAIILNETKLKCLNNFLKTSYASTTITDLLFTHSYSYSKLTIINVSFHLLVQYFQFIGLIKIVRGT